MDSITAWLTAHTYVAGILTPIAVVLGLALLWGLWVFYMWMQWTFFRPDRSGAKLILEALTVTHDAATDEVVFTWPLRNTGKFAARDLRAVMTVTVKQTNGVGATWQLNPAAAVLEPGEPLDMTLRVARHELHRLAGDFKRGNVRLYSHYSSSAPGKDIIHFGATGPHGRYTLSVGPLGGAACVTVTDFTPME